MDASRRKVIHDALVRLSDGDRSAFPLLVAALWPVVRAFARRGLEQEADAEDVAQEVFLRICSRIADFDRRRDGLSWAFGIAAFEVKTQRQRKTRRRELLGAALPPALADGAASQEERLLGQELEAALAHALASLGDDDRRTLGLAGAAPAAAAAGADTDTDAETTIGAAAIRKRRQRALGRLRDLWRSIHGEPR